MTSYNAGSSDRSVPVIVRSLLALAAAGLTSAAGAQESPADEISEVVVSGSPIRDSLERSLQLQRLADNVINAIAADAIGQFPDQTAAAALARLPGIAVQRDQGQERYVQVRGAPARWSVVSFDGINVLGAEERIFRFDSVPAAMIQTIELNKNLTADMPAEALAGRVNIRTFSALDNPGFRGLFDAGYGRVDLGDGPQRQFAGRMSFGGERFGVVLAASKYFFEQQTDNTEPRYDATGMREVRAAKYIIGRETSSLSGKLEFAPADGHRLSFSALSTEFSDAEQRNQYTFNFAGGTGTRNAQGGSLVTVPVAGLFEQGEYEQGTDLFVLRGDHTLGAWQAEWNLAYAETLSLIDLPLVAQQATNRALRPSLDFTIGADGLPVIKLYDTVQTGATFSRGAPRTSLNQRAFDLEAAVIFGLQTRTKSYTAKGDAERAWQLFGRDATLKLGFQYDDRESADPGNKALLRPNGTAGSLLFRTTAAQLGVPWTPLDLVTGIPFDEAIQRGYTTNYLDNASMRRQFDALVLAAQAANQAGGAIPVPRPNPALANSVAEKILALYASNTWRWGRQSVVAGARIERTAVSSVGFAQLGTTLTPFELDGDNTFVFPSLHWNFDVTEDVKLRAALVTGAARPTFVDQRAAVTINDALQTVSGGNPALKPERAVGSDLSAEWYFAPSAILSASAFYRDVSDTLFDAVSTVGDGRYDFNGVDRSGYVFTTTQNGGGGELYGIELAWTQPFTFLPGLLSGFGIQSSIAFIDGSFDTPTGRTVAFPGTSRRVTNIALFYEKAGLSARLGWQHRTPWLDDISLDAAGDLYWDTQQRLDFSIRYQLSSNFQLYGDVNNLSDELGVRYEGNRSRPYEVEGFGRRVMAGVRVTF